MNFWNSFNPFNNYLEESCKLLNIDINFNEATLKEAYHKLVLLNHPDKGGKTENFIKINEAYKFLSSLIAEKPKSIKISEPSSNNKKSKNKTHNIEVKKKINEIKPKNVLYKLEIELSDVYFGLKKKIKLQRNRICLTCKKNNKLYTISTCNECHNKKFSLQIKEIELILKPGVYSGYKIVYKGEGEEYLGYEPGDIIFEIVVKENKFLIRNGSDLFMNKNISLKESLGIEYILICLFDRSKFFINKNKLVICPGDTKTVIGKGVPFFNDNSYRGNLHIKFNVIFPKIINNDQKNIIKNVLDGNYNMYLNGKKNVNKKNVDNRNKRNNSSGSNAPKIMFNLNNNKKNKNMKDNNKEVNRTFDKENGVNNDNIKNYEILELKDFSDSLLNAKFTHENK